MPDDEQIIDEGNGSAVVIEDDIDSGGGIIRTITAVSLNDDTVTPELLLKGITAHDASGRKIIGTYVPKKNNGPDVISSAPVLHRDRLSLQNILEEIFSIFHEADGHQHVYYQPDTNIKLHYPCAVYTRDGDVPYNADNGHYVTNWAYRITIIDQDPISSCINKEGTKTIIDAISELPKCSYIRHFVSENLNHDVFKIYYK